MVNKTDMKMKQFMQMKKTISILFLMMTTILWSCEKPDDNISAPRYGLAGVAAQFADESISTEQFTSTQEPPYGDTIRIQFPKYYPRNSMQPIDITRMRITATLPVNVIINPKLTVMDLTKENIIEVVNNDGTIDKHIIIGEILP
jgi:hypothetical protein